MCLKSFFHASISCHGSTLIIPVGLFWRCAAVYCSVLQRVAACCSVLQCVAVCCSVSEPVLSCINFEISCNNGLGCVAVYDMSSQVVAVSCSELQ